MVRIHRFGEDIRERGFAESGRPGKQDVIERFIALARGGDGDFQAFFHLCLTGEVREKRRSQRQFERGVGFVECRNGPFSHVASAWAKQN